MNFQLKSKFKKHNYLIDFYIYHQACKLSGNFRISGNLAMLLKSVRKSSGNFYIVAKLFLALGKIYYDAACKEQSVLDYPKGQSIYTCVHSAI